MSSHPFDFIELPAARGTAKPRARGLAMTIDWGLGLRRLEDTLEISGAYVDLGKIAVGTPRLYDETLLKRKFEIYAAHQSQYCQHHAGRCHGDRGSAGRLECHPCG